MRVQVQQPGTDDGRVPVLPAFWSPGRLRGCTGSLLNEVVESPVCNFPYMLYIHDSKAPQGGTPDTLWRALDLCGTSCHTKVVQCEVVMSMTLQANEPMSRSLCQAQRPGEKMIF